MGCFELYGKLNKKATCQLSNSQDHRNMSASKTLHTTKIAFLRKSRFFEKVKVFISTLQEAAELLVGLFEVVLGLNKST